MKIIVTIFLSVLLFANCTKYKKNETKANWIANAFKSLENNEFPKVKAIAWWNENFDNTFLRVNTSQESLEAYKKGVSSEKFISDLKFENNILVATENKIYHSALTGFGGTEDVVTKKSIADFENLVEKDVAWVYFSNNWFTEIKFPKDRVKTISDLGKTPFIRMMPRTNFEDKPDPNYTMQNIIDGKFDTAIIQWAIDAKNTNIPLLVEFGTEVNGDWFSWNGSYNGGSETTNYGNPNLADGPERFQDAYKHIIDICRNNGTTNISWFFHIDAFSSPNETWNKMENYYPGDNYIDWLGVSVYGPQEKGDEYLEFNKILNNVYPDLVNISDKPIAILEFAITEI